MQSLRAKLEDVGRKLAEEKREKAGKAEELLRERQENAQKSVEMEGLQGQVAVFRGRLCVAKEERRREEEGTVVRLAKLEEDLIIAREVWARRKDEADRLEYVLALNGQVGSVPRSVLASDPESVLYKMFCGDWDYARDEKGRALITCHPKRWAAVLEHLTTGAVPAERDPLLLEQARYWNLNRLVRGLEALTPGVVVTNDPDAKGFKARCMFVSVLSQLTTGDKSTRLVFAAPPGRWWAVQLHERGTYLWSVVPPGGTEIKRVKLLTLKWRLLLRSEELERDTGSVVYPANTETGWGQYWERWGFSFQQLVTEPLARTHDSLVIEFLSADYLSLTFEAPPVLKMATEKADIVASSNQQSGSEPEDLNKERVNDLSTSVQNTTEEKKEDKTADLKLDSHSEDADVNHLMASEHADVDLTQQPADLQHAVHTQEDGEATLTQQPGEDSKAEAKPQEKQVADRGDQTEPVIAVAPAPKAAVLEPVQTRQATKKLETIGGKRKAQAVGDESVKKPCLVVEP
ncbi:hypothetical protein KFL_002820130 [Klebsormidium nitens]|uniref:Uncharacterized protein n=1 Tax=Klebsormidium nitens TaxID=105231 RepID=A0A1Y1IE06_KLENI|nr:hypothetical protein KFL_002820130 [Klebsormidium nitens]|eukprot:GAQ86318.1 hypothetical protein KFL_002820130 [Klebsormidium nitens]